MRWAHPLGSLELDPRMGLGFDLKTSEEMRDVGAACP